MKFLDDSYRLLGLHPGVGTDRVRRAFRRAAQKCHPDLAVATGSDEFIKLRRAFRLALGYEEGRAKGSSTGDRDKKETEEERAGSVGSGELDLRLILKLDRAEAARGLETVIIFQRRVPCPSCRGCCPGCGGIGWVMAQGNGSQGDRLVRRPCPLCRGRSPYHCPDCRGKGHLEEEAEERILIPPGLDGTELLVMPEMGHVSPAGAGNLILNVVVE